MHRIQYSRRKFDPLLIEISDDDLAAVMERVRPLILRDGYLFALKEMPDPRRVAFTWDTAELVDLDSHEEWYVEIGRGTTQHSCAYHGFFKPTLAEVYAQVPNDPRITAFYIDSQSVVILNDSAGHEVSVHWLTNISEPRR